MNKAIVMGANGFLGSHVTQELVKDGRDVRVMVRKNADTRGIDGLNVERVHGDVLDVESLKNALRGCDTVFYCVVDTRAWLRDPAPLFRVNVDGLRNVLDIALESGVRKFIFTSSIGTIGKSDSGTANETDSFNWHKYAPDYIISRLDAENLLLEYCKRYGLDGCAMCVANTFGAGDYAPTPHGQLLYEGATGKIPFYWAGTSSAVGISDAARAMVLAEKHGRRGERYIIADRTLTFRELFQIGASELGTRPPSWKMPLAVMYFIAAVATVVAAITKVDNKMPIASVRLTHFMDDMDASKAKRELHWQPEPVENSVRAAVRFYRDNKIRGKRG